MESEVVTDGKNKAAVLTEASLILAAVFPGTKYAATKFAAPSIPPLSFVTIRFLMGGILLYCVLRLVEPESWLGRRDLPPDGGLGLLEGS